MKRVKWFLLVLITFCAQLCLTSVSWAADRTDYTLYADFLKQDEFVYTLQKPDDSGHRTYGLTFYDRYGSARYEKQSVSFCLLDLDGDGTKEMIVGRMASSWEPKAMQLYVFTIRSGKVQFVKYMGTNDYSFRCSGQKITYSARYGALYCRNLEQNSDARFDDETTTYTLYKMSGLRIRRFRYADAHLKRRADGKGSTLAEYRYQKVGSSTLKSCTGSESRAYRSYCNTWFKSLKLKSCRMYQNTSANRQKLLGKA